jgi:hypothetical protein
MKGLAYTASTLRIVKLCQTLQLSDPDQVSYLSSPVQSIASSRCHHHFFVHSMNKFVIFSIFLLALLTLIVAAVPSYTTMAGTDPMLCYPHLYSSPSGSSVGGP